MCRQLKVSRSSYYHWKNTRGHVNSYAQRRAALANEVKEIFIEQRSRAGAGGITAEMRRRGHSVSVKLVSRIMRETTWSQSSPGRIRKPPSAVKTPTSMWWTWLSKTLPRHIMSQAKFSLVISRI